MEKTLLSFCLFSLLSITTITAQCLVGDCQNGEGTYLYPSGAKYVGEFANGEIHGVGVCYYTDGGKYAGQWANRYPEGKGTKTYADGSKRTGQWLKGQPVDEQGQVIELEAKGSSGDDGTDIQSGCIMGDCQNGEGTFAYADGSKYEGQFKNGSLDGWGTWYFPNGDKYIGTFKNNYSHGKGTLYEINGQTTTGEWVEGEYVGDSRAEMGREGCIKGDCTDGQGTYVYQNAEAKYVGAFQQGQAHGKGICYYANGERYEGEWKDGQFHGLGTLFMKDGTVASGEWREGTFVGEVAAETPAKPTMEEVIAEEMGDQSLQEEARRAKVWAVVIGIGAYSHMPALRYTDDDAYRMYAFLKSPEGGALSDDHIRILIDEDATKQRITKTMTEVFSQAGPDDLVILYFSGHGLKGSFLPIDFDGFNNKLFHEEINEIFKSSPAKYKLCIADACHSGSLFAMKGT
ncbi:MAG: caspase family protein, partial [Bacteroidota bacterium]